MAIKTEITYEGLSAFATDRDKVAAKLAHIGTDAPVTLNHPVLTDGRPMFGFYNGLTYYSASGTFASTFPLSASTINGPIFTGESALTTPLPSATVGAKVVLLLRDGPNFGGTIDSTLIIQCSGSDVFETGCTVPTTSANKWKYDVSLAEESTLTYTPTDAATNFMGMGSTMEFICANVSQGVGKWFVHVDAQPDKTVVEGQCTGTLVFS
tara:strand:- start:143 stop:772 length:630 start_codon:yes stop_codon:yes gene_type:complete